MAAAASAEQVLRFVAEVGEDQIKVGPAAVAKDSPLGGLQGSDNMIVFESERYNDRPLVITGPGAGIDVTAMVYSATFAHRSGAQTTMTSSAFAPATVADLGPGFDVIGLAIDGMGDTVTVRASNKPGVTIARIEGDGGNCSP